MSKKHLVVVAGPTASGKTRLAVELGKRYAAPVLSADSRQFYRELRIGTAKPSQDELQGVPHYFIDSKNVDELYGAGHFEKDAIEQLGKIYQTADVAILAGGSGLYIDAVLKGVDEFEEVPAQIRDALNQQLLIEGMNALREELRLADPEFYNEVDLNNPQRVVRALEVIRHTGQKFSGYRKKKSAQRPFEAVKILLEPPRAELYRKIDERVDSMMASGLLEEVKQLYNRKNLNALKTVGYRELYDYLENRHGLPRAVELIKQHSRNYAKRQLTWFRRDPEYKRFDPAETERIFSYLDSVIGR